MVIFDKGEFEIAIVTYNRSSFIEKWLDNCYLPAAQRNITISIYDSSTNDETRDYINAFNVNKNSKVEYFKLDSSTIIGYKPMCPILNCKAKFLWVSGDSRYHDFDELDEHLFKYIHSDTVDYAALAIVNNRENGGKIYTDHSEMIHDFFVSSTCIGLSVYRVSIFETIKNDKEYKSYLDGLFKENYAFAWLGYFYHVFSKENYRALFVNAKVYDILQDKKVQTWAKRFYGCWVDDLLELIDKLPDSYINKNMIPKEVWKIMYLDAVRYCYRARKKGDLNATKYIELKKDKKLYRVTDKIAKIGFFAKGPIFILTPIYYVNLLLVNIYDVLFVRNKK